MFLFQSLFCWKFLLGSNERVSREVHSVVSILVLLEVPLRPSAIVAFGTNRSCFNPCFVGSSSQAQILHLQEFQLQQFQSLFCWKFLLGAACHHCRASDFHCFNPCFVGSSSQAVYYCIKLIAFSGFQSLFCWKFLLGSEGNEEHGPGTEVSILVLLEVPLRHQFAYLQPTQVVSFNPCFVGSSSQAPNSMHWYCNWVPFQSLFCWKFLLGKKAGIISNACRRCFNPCFVGSSSQAQSPNISHAHNYCFNPCFVGSSSQAKLKGEEE